MRKASVFIIALLFLFAAGNVQKTEAAPDNKTVGDPFEFICFGDEADAVQLLTQGDKDAVKVDVSGNGSLISGKNADIKAGSFTLSKQYDFGSDEKHPVRRVRIDGLAKIGTNTSIALYLDDETEPFAKKQLNDQSKKGNWDEELPVFLELQQPVNGRHALTIRVEDVSTSDNKKTETLIRSLKFYRETLPIVYVNIDESIGTIEAMNSDEEHKTRCYGSVTIQVPNGYKNTYNEEGSENYAGGDYKLDYIRGRGESTWRAKKKPYKLKFEEAVDLFGMGSCKDWALIANYFDRSLVRNRLTYYLGDALGIPFTPKLVPIEVVMNGDYLGLYYLSETISVDDSRVDIDNLEDITADDDDLSGGYLLAVKRQFDEPEEHWFLTDRSMPWIITSPDEFSDPDITDERIDEIRSYIMDYVQRTEDAIYSKDHKTADGELLSDLLDLESAAKYYLIQEISRNTDAFLTDSTYMYKPRGEKLFFGPLWDFDYAAWAADNKIAYSKDAAEVSSTAEGFLIEYPWMNRLREDPAFIDEVLRAFGGKGQNDPDTFYYQLNELSKDGGILDQWEAELSAAAECNADIPWAVYDPLASEMEEGEISPLIEYEFPDEIARLKFWIQSRINWFDKNKADFAIDPVYCTLNFYSDDKLLETRTLHKGDEITDLPVPQKTEGRYFAGWYMDTAYTDDLGEETILNGRLLDGDPARTDLDLTARWISDGDESLPEALFFAKKDYYMPADEVLALPCTIMPEGSCDLLFYESSDPDAASVDDNGRVHALIPEGEFVITAASVNGKKAECTVHVLDKDAEMPDAYALEADETEITLKEGEYTKIDFNYSPEDAKAPNLQILNSNEEIAEMTPEGVVVARSKGTDVFFVVCDSVSDVLKITVTVTKV